MMNWLLMGLVGVIVIQGLVFLALGVMYLRILARKAEQEHLQQVWWALQGMARSFVLAAEGLYTADDADGKRDYVINRLLEMVKQTDLPIEINQLEAMLESAVKDMQLDLVGRMGPPDVFSG